YAPLGLDIPALHAYVAANGSLAGYTTDVERTTNEELLQLDCDILVLAAREDQVTGANAGKLRCRLVAEGANGPTSVAADAILAERGIRVQPAADLVAVPEEPPETLRPPAVAPRDPARPHGQRGPHADPPRPRAAPPPAARRA